MILHEVEFVEKADPEYTSGHEDHLAIEFENWVIEAMRMKRDGKL